MARTTRKEREHTVSQLLRRRRVLNGHPLQTRVANSYVHAIRMHSKPNAQITDGTEGLCRTAGEYGVVASGYASAVSVPAVALAAL